MTEIEKTVKTVKSKKINFTQLSLSGNQVELDRLDRLDRLDKPGRSNTDKKCRKCSDTECDVIIDNTNCITARWTTTEKKKITYHLRTYCSWACAYETNKDAIEAVKELIYMINNDPRGREGED